jgi:hypothetical protein
MSCRYCDYDGYCAFWDKHIEMLGCDENGACICETDEEPFDLCDMYEEA